MTGLRIEGNGPTLNATQRLRIIRVEGVMTMTDSIERQVLLNATIERVWQAISDSAQFGRWFGARFDGPFEAGQRVAASMVPTEVDADVARSQEPYAGMRFYVWVERVEPPRHLSFRWQPGAEVSGDPASLTGTTLVNFHLEEAPGGTRLTIRETGFDTIPLERRARAFADNEQGWEIQATLIAKYLAAHDA